VGTSENIWDVLIILLIVSAFIAIVWSLYSMGIDPGWILIAILVIYMVL